MKEYNFKDIELEIRDYILAKILDWQSVLPEYKIGLRIQEVSPPSLTNYRFDRHDMDYHRYYVIFCKSILIAHYHPRHKTLEILSNDQPEQHFITKNMERLFTIYIPGIRITELCIDNSTLCSSLSKIYTPIKTIKKKTSDLKVIAKMKALIG